MSDMFYDMETEEVQRRIRKFRDPKSHVKYRLDQGTVLVDLVDRMVHASIEDDDEDQGEDAAPASDEPTPGVTGGGIVEGVKSLFK